MGYRELKYRERPSKVISFPFRSRLSGGQQPSIIGSIFLILVAFCQADAQTFRGTILGTVTDTSGAVIQDATVRAKNTATGLERVTSTDAEGNYVIAELPIGTYDVKIEKRGF